MVKDFSQVGTGNRPVAATGSTGGGSGFFSDRKRVIATGVVAVVFLALVIALLTSGGSDDDKGSGADAIRAAHGPTTTIDGVPAGYTRDQAGAQTAAVNFIQANGQTYQAGSTLRSCGKSLSRRTPRTLECRCRHLQWPN